MDIFLQFDNREHKEPRLWELLFDGMDSRYAVCIGQAKIHQCNVRQQSSVGTYGVGYGARLSYDFHILLIVQRTGQSHTHHEMVIH